MTINDTAASTAKSSGVQAVGGQVRQALDLSGEASRRLLSLVDAIINEKRYPAADAGLLIRSVLAIAALGPDVAIYVVNARGKASMPEHSLDVAVLSALICSGLGLGQTETESAVAVGLLHDIGKLRFKGLLRKKTPLTLTDAAQMAAHPIFSRQFLERAEGAPKRLLDLVEHHHDFMGKAAASLGAGERLILHVVAVCDAYCRLVCPPNGGRPVTPCAAVRQVEQRAGVYDQRVLGEFMRLMSRAPANTFYVLPNGKIGVVLPRRDGSAPRGLLVCDPDAQHIKPVVQSMDSDSEPPPNRSVRPESLPTRVLKKLAVPAPTAS